MISVTPVTRSAKVSRWRYTAIFTLKLSRVFASLFSSWNHHWSASILSNSVWIILSALSHLICSMILVGSDHTAHQSWAKLIIPSEDRPSSTNMILQNIFFIPQVYCLGWFFANFGADIYTMCSTTKIESKIL